MADLCLGPGGNPFTAYVAFTRVQGRNKLLLFRPFDAAPFQKGVGLGRDLLLRQLRGDRIDWKALLAKYCEERPCANCCELKQACTFACGQWKRGGRDCVCRECTKRRAVAGAPWQCNVCKQWRAKANFPQKHQQRQCSFYRVCLTCEVQKTCIRCKKPKAEAEFGLAAWKARHAERRVCHTCAVKERGSWVCYRCRNRLPKTEFNAWQRRRAYAQDGAQTCNSCRLQALIAHAARRAQERVAPLQRKKHARRCASPSETDRCKATPPNARVMAILTRRCHVQSQERRPRPRENESEKRKERQRQQRAVQTEVAPRQQKAMQTQVPHRSSAAMRLPERSLDQRKAGKSCSNTFVHRAVSV